MKDMHLITIIFPMAVSVCCGAFLKKMVVADNLRPVMQSIFDQYAELSGITCYLGCV